MAALLGAFMTADKLWLHWYTPEAVGTTVERNAQFQPASATQQLTPAGSAPGGSVTEQRSPAASPQTTDAQANAPAPSDRSRDAFAALWVAGQQATYRARYETSSASGEKGDSYVVFNRPPAARVDTIAEGAREPSSQIILDLRGSTFACSFDGGERNCGQIKPFDRPLPLAAGPIIFPAAASFGSISVAEVDSRTIVGAPTRCFRVLAAGTADPADYCFSAERVPVYGNGPFGIVEASELSSASDADFVVATP
ncbi:MAG: hypothetical protein M3P30_08305 [Chloroflexota bacterium]|nr:hypothetical protein [Chloroflexota bacterium]